MRADLLTGRQREPYDAVTAAATSIDERLGMLYPLANRLGSAEADVRAVRAVLVEPYTRECAG